MFNNQIRLLTAMALGLSTLAVAVWVFGTTIGAGPAQSIAYAAGLHYVAPGGICGGPTPCYAGVQAAVDAAGDGDEIRVAGGTYADLQRRGNITEVVYISKTLTVQGGYAVNNWTTPDVTGNPTTLDAQFQGLVVVISGSISPTITGLRITRGYADWPHGVGADRGGGVYVMTATALLSSNIIFNNYANYGGGVYLGSSASTLSRNTITGNWGGAYGFNNSGILGGGGVYLDNSPANLSGNTINGNNTGYLYYNFSRGGGVYLNHSPATLTGNAIRNNTGYFGFGVYLNESDAVLTGNSISGNQHNGVDIDNSAVSLNNNTINNNLSGISTSYSYVTLTGNIISNNRGRGADFHKGTASLSYNTIYLNSGFAVYLYALDDAQMLHNTIAYNSRGLYQYRRNATLLGNLISHNGNWGTAYSVAMFSPNTTEQTLINNVIADNGGGLSLGGSNPRLLHTTFARNGGGLSIVSGNTMLTNTILVNEPVGISAAAGSTATLNGVLWFGNGLDSAGAGTINIANAFSGDPAFAADGYHLMTGSSAIDKGVNAGVTTDIDGRPRPSGAAPDLGAVEYYPLDHHAYLPLVSR